MQKFEFTENHLKLLRRMYVGWQDCEFGAPEIDPKRPYGNSAVEEDIAIIIGMRKDYNDISDNHLSGKEEKECQKLHTETEKALQIFLQHARLSEGSFKVADSYSSDWKKA